MKKILSIILPSVIIFTFSYSVRHGDKDLLLGIYILFPIIFMIQGIMYSNSKKTLVVGLALSSIAVLLPIFVWYNVADMMTATIIYLLLGFVSFTLSNKIRRKV